MCSYLKKNKWSAYTVGILLAILSVCSFYCFNAMLGVSTTFVRIAAGLLSLLAPEYVAQNAYYSQYLDNSYWISWQFALVVGIPIGSYIASRLHGPITSVSVPSIWKNSFGPSTIKRFIGAFLGGVLILFGARLASGCTSGHAITGGMQLTLASWIFMMAVFATGIPTAFILYSRKRK